MSTNHYPFPVQPLPYDADALVPHLDARTITIHHDKHYATYVERLNSVLKNYPALQDWSLEQLLTRLQELPEEIRTPIQNNGGGVYNHQLYFQNMAPSGQKPSPHWEQELSAAYGSVAGFYDAFRKAAMGLFGSGYAWLLQDNNGQLSITTTPNQNVPNLNRYQPLLTLDLWEHAYYLQYQNRKDAYIDNWLQIINWEGFPE